MSEKEILRNQARRLGVIRHFEEVTKNISKTCRYFGISMVFPGYQRSSEPVSEIAALQKEEASELILRFVKEVVLRNQGTMKMGADEKKTKTYIFLRFPVERRKVVYYQSVN